MAEFGEAAAAGATPSPTRGMRGRAPVVSARRSRPFAAPLNRHLGAVLLLPSALTFLVLLVFPLGYGIYTSFLQRHVLDPEGVWVGLANYAWLFGNAERSEEHTSELQSRQYLVCRLLLEKKKTKCNFSETVDSKDGHTNNDVFYSADY